MGYLSLPSASQTLKFLLLMLLSLVKAREEMEPPVSVVGVAWSAFEVFLGRDINVPSLDGNEIAAL